MPPSVKNAIFQAIQDVDLDPGEFEWDLVEGPWMRALYVSRLMHKRTGFFLVFDMGTSDYHLYAWPGGEHHDLGQPRVTDLAKEWVRLIESEIKQPDLWQLFKEQQRLGADPQTENTPFTAEEQARIAEGLVLLEEHVYQSEPDLPIEKRHAVAARFRFLKDAAARLGRLDWMSMVIGQLFAMASERIITVQTFHSLYNMAAVTFGKMLQVAGQVANLLGGGG